jgi:hypothetical protein
MLPRAGLTGCLVVPTHSGDTILRLSTGGTDPRSCVG